MSGLILVPDSAVERRRLRAWLDHVATLAIDWLDELDELDAVEAELEDDECEDDREAA